MRIDDGLRWKGLALLAVLGLAACGGGAKGEGEDESEDHSPSGPTAVVTPTPQPNPTPSPTPDPIATPAPAAASVAYEQDIRPILEADCLRCHGELGSYTGTMGYVVPGSASSLLVRATQPGGSMFGHLSGDAAGKAELIRRWVVEGGAARSR
jgi:hypothetical protein